MRGIRKARAALELTRVGADSVPGPGCDWPWAATSCRNLS
jgi:hypothetical protein